MAKRCDDCGKVAMFAWRWPGMDVQGYLCFIHSAWRGRPGAERLAIRAPKDWAVSKAGWLPV